MLVLSGVRMIVLRYFICYFRYGVVCSCCGLVVLLACGWWVFGCLGRYCSGLRGLMVMLVQLIVLF